MEAYLSQTGVNPTIMLMYHKKDLIYILEDQFSYYIIDYGKAN